MTALFARHGVQVWLPEAGGPIDIDSPAHQALMTLLGAQSQREVLRSRYRVLAAMQNQVADQGRYLGGRPPYGYRLVDAGPHPNRALNGRGVPCPSHVDPERNSHRSGEAWTLRTVSVILNNPRYTGREGWNRTRHDRHAPASAPHPTTQACVVSKKIAHPPLVTERDFLAVQAIRSARPTKDGTTRTYLLTGLLRCRLCRRRMDSHWVNGRPGYRCRHGHTSTRRRTPGQPKTLYVREDLLLTALTSPPTRPPAVRPANRTARTRPKPAETQRIAAFLRSSQTMIIYDGTSWSLDTPDRARQANPTPDR